MALRKLGFNPESFTRITPEQNMYFAASFKDKPMSEKMKITSPATLVLLALGSLLSHKLRDQDPDGLLPKLTAGLLVSISGIRWINANRREKQRFVNEYNAAMNTTYSVENQRMRDLWDAAHSGLKDFTKTSEFDPTKVRQKQGFDSKAEYKNNRNVPTPQAIQRLADEWINREPPEGVVKETKVPDIKGHFKSAGLHEDVKKHYNYGKYLAKHKRSVYKAGRQIGADPIVLLKHDLTKLKPSSWKPYADYFYGSKGIRGTAPSRTFNSKLGLVDPEVHKKFRAAAQRHHHAEPHHGYKIGKPHPFENQLESLADWYSVGKITSEEKTGKPYMSFSQWFHKNKSKLNIAPELRELASVSLK